MARTEVRRLIPVAGYPFPVRASAGAESRADELAARTERALTWMTDALRFTPTVRLNVVDERDRPGVTSMPLYGMPHAHAGDITIGVGEAPFYREQLDSFTPYLSDTTRANLREEYGEPASLLPYYETIHVHELTHLYHQQDWNSYPDLWLVELHANLAMVGYLNEMEPDMLPAMQALTTAVYDLPAESLRHRDLGDMQHALEHSLFNYAWYFFHLTLAADELWETGGTPLLRRLYSYVRARQHAASPGPVTRDQMWAVHPALAQIMDEWPSGELPEPTRPSAPADVTPEPTA
ncbi:MAG TPA: hypothetical protein VLH10_00910 [Yinghuangia sp.]|nr:hypothetical protein [Yinghuangia sp.]